MKRRNMGDGTINFFVKDRSGKSTKFGYLVVDTHGKKARELRKSSPTKFSANADITGQIIFMVGVHRFHTEDYSQAVAEIGIFAYEWYEIKWEFDNEKIVKAA